MIKEKYLEQITNQVGLFREDKNLKFFLFGSSLIKDHFGDVDLGVLGDISKQDILQLKEDFENSTLPYFVDVVHFDKTSEEFKNNVFNNKILWIKHLN